MPSNTLLSQTNFYVFDAKMKKMNLLALVCPPFHFPICGCEKCTKIPHTQIKKFI